MATFTDVDTEVIKQAAQVIRQNIDEINGIKTGLDSNVLSKLVPCWQGEAMDLFSQQFALFSESLKTLVEGYEALYSDLEAAGGVYRQANEQVTGQVSNLR